MKTNQNPKNWKSLFNGIYFEVRSEGEKIPCINVHCFDIVANQGLKAYSDLHEASYQVSLCAAAPDLLDAAKKALMFVEDIFTKDMLQAAITKAETPTPYYLAKEPKKAETEY